MGEIVTKLGCFPLEEPEHRQQAFLKQATKLLEQRQWVGVFPEGAQPMVRLTKPSEMGKFHRGFVHLAMPCPDPGFSSLASGDSEASKAKRRSLPYQKRSTQQFHYGYCVCLTPQNHCLHNQAGTQWLFLTALQY